jgi:uncharacterized protein
MRRTEREVTDITEIESIIYGSDVCRIALADNNIPYIVTMNFGYSSGIVKKLFFHCSREGRKLEMIRKNNYVCFEMDSGHKLTEGEVACDFSMKYKSVVGWGRIHIIDTDEGKREGLNIIMNQYTGKIDFTYKVKSLSDIFILRLDITEMTGKHS